MIDTIVYHADCPDGFCAAYVAKNKYPDAALVPATYGQTMNVSDFKGKHVLVVDFSWKRAETECYRALAASLTILDHHKTAEAELAGLPYATFDMNRSGAQLAWDYCNDSEYLQLGGLWNPELMPFLRRPWYVDYVADRDLWRWALPQSKEINAYLMSLPHSIQAWTKMDLSETVTSAAVLGRGARAQVDHYVEKVCAQAYKGTWDQSPEGIWPVANPYYTLSIVNALSLRRFCNMNRLFMTIAAVASLTVSLHAQQGVLAHQDYPVNYQSLSLAAGQVYFTGWAVTCPTRQQPASIPGFPSVALYYLSDPDSQNLQHMVVLTSDGGGLNVWPRLPRPDVANAIGECGPLPTQLGIFIQPTVPLPLGTRVYTLYIMDPSLHTIAATAQPFLLTVQP